jgi:SagB-type dehydrogenase family enzyme
MLRKVIGVFLILVLSGGIAMAARTISLPDPKIIGKMSFEETISRRRSERGFEDKDLSMEQISQILWAAQGITDTAFGFRAAPSAGALYPLKIYIIKKDGLYRYIPDDHKLLQLSSKDLRPSLLRVALGQSFIREAPIDIIIAANFNIVQAKYGPRAFRYTCMEAGHVAENIHLQAVALGLVSVAVGAFWDDAIKKILELPENQDPLYIIPIGYKK